MKRAILICAIAAMLQPRAAVAADLVVTKTVAVISDPVGSAAPKSLPGAVADYKVLFTNPLANAAQPVRAIVVVDVLPANVILRVTDLAGPGMGPVEFVDGNLLGLGLGSSGLTCGFTSLSSITDCIEFSTDGTTWSYVPVPDADGYDANVRAIRVKPVTTFSTTGSFQLRYRVKIK
ncbi:hypothetical protein [uncultured Sphingomonas sp.]|uniref:hypothetical protein n=1 Tax=uncultured Sphingomonas sp. TaxID=158754 RepID=UPI0035CA97DA